MVQYGFLYDQNRCTDCRECSIACKTWNGVPPGPVKWLRVLQYETGAFPDVTVKTQWLPCYHCENPVCVDAANGAMYKEDKYGAVLIDPDKATSPDLRKAQEACPYGAIQFDSDSANATASKCTMCMDRLERGEKPVCVNSCYMRALDFDTMENLTTRYGTNRDLVDLPSSEIAKPAVVFKPAAPKKQIVPYDKNKAIVLLARRDPLPPLYTDPSDVTDLPIGLIGRNKLVLKPRNTQEALQAAKNDEG